MKHIALISTLLSYFIFSSSIVDAQNRSIDSLKAILQSESKDTVTVNKMNRLTYSFLDLHDCDSGLRYSNQSIKLADELKYKEGGALARYYSGVALRCKGDYTEAYRTLIESKKIFDELNNERYVAKCLRNIGIIFQEQDNSTDALENYFSALSVSEGIRDTAESMNVLIEITGIFYDNEKFDKALEYAKRYETYAYGQDHLHPRDIVTQQLGYIYEALKNDSLSLYYQLASLHLSELQKDTLGIGNSYMDLSDLYLNAKKYEQSIEYLRNAEKMYRVINDSNGVAGSFFKRARVYMAFDKKDLALKAYAESLRLAELQKDDYDIAANYLDLGRVYFGMNQYSKAHYYFQLFSDLSKRLKQKSGIAEGYKSLSLVNEKLNKPAEALINLKMYLELKDSIDQKSQAVNLVEIEAKRNFEKVVQENKIQQEKERLESTTKIYALLVGLLFLVLLAALLYRNNRQKQKARKKIERAFDELKLTQNQLIQSEKMASLGELTAGIAHEIQNPLNFVNNFSDVNKELLEEMKDEMSKGHIDEANAIANDVMANEEKINHHGKRADAIVKGMLQHSRTTSGLKEPTDINALADEYLRLAYHGLRAKDKNFNATTRTDFDSGIGNINVVPQDIGRVILNLITNAFYAVNERKKQSGNQFDPTVIVSTKKFFDKILISVKDNGNGIPQKVLDKIFQPFFTTKPTGQGTGLGLSLSYDIMKAHGGEIKVTTSENSGTEFTIVLPA